MHYVQRIICTVQYSIYNVDIYKRVLLVLVIAVIVGINRTINPV